MWSSRDLYLFVALVFGLYGSGRFQTEAVGLNFWRMMTGIGLGVELVTIDAYLSELVPPRVRGRAPRSTR